MYENIGENLKLLRQRRKPEYSQREIAEKLKVNRNTYAKYEQGKLVPPVWFLYEVPAPDTLCHLNLPAHSRHGRQPLRKPGKHSPDADSRYCL